MTVIALLEDLGTAFADVMLSVETQGEHIVMPSTGDTRILPVELDASPTRLVRKFLRLSLAHAAGTFLVAGTVSHIRQLAMNLQRVESDPASLDERYQRILAPEEPISIFHTGCVLTEEEGYADFELIGVLDGQMITRMHQASLRLDRSPYFGTLRTAGSGAIDLHAWLNSRGQQYDSLDLAQDCVATKMERSLHLIPSMLLEEDTRTTFHTLKRGVGGYYESYYIDGETLLLEPLDSVLTVFAAVVEGAGGPALELRRLFFHRYVDDWLVVASLFDLPARLDLDTPLIAALEDFTIFKIPPILDAAREPAMDAVELLAEVNACNYFRLTLYWDSMENGLTFHRFSEGPDLRRLLTCSLNPGDVRLAIDPVAFSYYLGRLEASVGSEAIVTLS
ncbi:hypothetical protein [Stenotrophomonas sp.]|uniref:hypothetical protein n=1 Tax=Stenotrophomonas sp. TaxID=69392 RepID=UPI00289DC07A|nr:hypothetical protein [Stenotrophomonas sp.]